MKHKGSHFEYAKERDCDLMRAFNEALNERTDFSRDMDELYYIAVHKPSRRFWVSEERALYVIVQMLKGTNLDNCLGNKKRMYAEILNRVTKLICDNRMTVGKAVAKVVSGPAPEFYITPYSAKIMIHKIKKRCYDERKRKLRHLL